MTTADRISAIYDRLQRRLRSPTLVARRLPVGGDRRRHPHPVGRLDQRGEGHRQPQSRPGCSRQRGYTALRRTSWRAWSTPPATTTPRRASSRPSPSDCTKATTASLEELFALDLASLRTELLSIHGVGPETADSIILYAAGKPSFVIDAYTRRIACRLGLAEPSASYADLQALFAAQPAGRRAALQRVPRPPGPPGKGGLPQAPAVPPVPACPGPVPRTRPPVDRAARRYLLAGVRRASSSSTTE